MAGFDESEKVRILLAEYQSTQSRLVARTGHALQFAGFCITAVSVWTTQPSSPRAFLTLALILVVAAIGSLFIMRDIGRASRRVREIEADVNRRAGEELLVWQSKWSPEATGFFGRPKS